MDLARRGRVRWMVLLAGVALVAACGSGSLAIPSGLPSLSLPTLSGEDPALVPPPGSVPKSLTGRITTVWDQKDPDNIYDATFVVDVKLKVDVIGTAQEGGEGFASYVDDGSTWTGAGLIRTFTKDPAGFCDTLNESKPNGSGGFDGAIGPRSISATTRHDSEGWTLGLEVHVDVPMPTRAIIACEETDGIDVWVAGLSCITPWLQGNRFEFPGDCLDLPHVRTRGTLIGS